ncbi:MAG: Re/Si-specific NAD(P)(+) transhydrogenase subunit alpha [bacterium TMED144]|nr:MAG: Re/Si-specific NAD(P)(+) transhydrogenase subunit alpha [bacterium TMED144]|tara:strand:- start:586 stop:1731 length:1146 start_codon:yes stop_codon:yes gene_type:complete
MIISILKELTENENRVAATPQSVKDLIKNGVSVNIESGAGDPSFISDNDYKQSGANICSSPIEAIKDCDIIVKVNPPSKKEIDSFPEGKAFISFIQTTKELDIVNRLVKRKITSFSMHLIPRTTLAQSMDALSSQANIAGYKAVLNGASLLPVYMPLLMTAAGTIPPAKVLIIGAGVAGLQAIATAKRLGAQVEAFDVRPEVKEQVESLGAKFVEVESDTNEGSGQGGYAKETSDEYKAKQQEKMTEHIIKSDLVITTALIPGRPAPKLISKSMVEKMKKGSVIVDLASENGGNCEATEKDKITNYNGVTIDGSSNLPSEMQLHASQLYAKNISTFINYMIKDGKINLDLDDEIISGAMFTHQGKINHKPTLEAINSSKDN